MSELKAYIGPAPDEKGLADYYLKSEADKVIAELKNEIEKQKRLRDMALASVPNVLKVMKIIQHQKYKRCLAMAQWCMDAECKTEKDADFLVRWEYRWLALAEEPTWAKFLQLIHKDGK